MTLDFVQVHGTVYTLSLSTDPLLSDGGPVDFLVDHPHESIHVSGQLGGVDLAAAAAHAVSYAWKTLPPSGPSRSIPLVGSVE